MKQDFKDILQIWENMNSKNPKTPQKKGGQKKQKFEDILNSWEKKSAPGKSAYIDKDALMEKSQEKRALLSKSYLESLRPDAIIDLHGKTQDEAWKALGDFVSYARSHSMKKILIIHGKGIHSADGDGVLGELVRKFIEYDPRLGASGHPTREHGGSGATWVAVKQ